MWHPKVDLANAFGAIQHHEIWQILEERIGAVGALAMMNVMCGHALLPHWLRFAGEAAPVHKGCK